MSTFLNSADFGRPNPLDTAYTAPATFDATTRITTWGAATGEVAADNSAELAFAGTSVNFAKTGGGWLKFSAVEADLDARGNGTVSAVVEYGTSTTGTPPLMQYDAQQAPDRGPQRITVVELAGNTAANIEAGSDQVIYRGLEGVWSSDFLTFLSGDGASIPAWSYASTINNTDADRAAQPFTFTVSRTALPASRQPVATGSSAGATAVNRALAPPRSAAVAAARPRSTIGAVPVAALPVAGIAALPLTDLPQALDLRGFARTEDSPLTTESAWLWWWGGGALLILAAGVLTLSPRPTPRRSGGFAPQ